MFYSIQVLASLSVRINAIIPPRASELRFLSAGDPVSVTIDFDRRHFGDQLQNVNSNEQNRREAENGLSDLQEDDAISVHRSRDNERAINSTALLALNQSSLHKDLLTYYRDLMSCMQGKNICCCQ